MLSPSGTTTTTTGALSLAVPVAFDGAGDSQEEGTGEAVTSTSSPSEEETSDLSPSQTTTTGALSLALPTITADGIIVAETEKTTEAAADAKDEAVVTTLPLARPTHQELDNSEGNAESEVKRVVTVGTEI